MLIVYLLLQAYFESLPPDDREVCAAIGRNQSLSTKIKVTRRLGMLSMRFTGKNLEPDDCSYLLIPWLFAVDLVHGKFLGYL